MKRVKAFTVVEMLIVCAIIGILIAIAVPGLNKAKAKAKARQQREKQWIVKVVSEPGTNGTIEVYSPVSLGKNLYFIPSEYNLSSSDARSDNSQQIAAINITLKNFLKTEDFKIINLVFTNDGVYVITT